MAVLEHVVALEVLAEELLAEHEDGSVGVADGDEASVVEHHDAVADPAHEVGGVGHEDDRAAVLAGTPRTRSRHFCWNASSPTASTSSTSSTSGSTLMATAKPSRTYMPDE